MPEPEFDPRLSDGDRETARLAIELLDRALISLNQPPLAGNDDFRVVEPMSYYFPNVILDKPGVAPFRFILADPLDIWLGRFYELLNAPISSGGDADAQRLIEQKLLSSVTVRTGRWWDEITFQAPGEKPFTSKYRPRTRPPMAEREYLPYVK